MLRHHPAAQKQDLSRACGPGTQRADTPWVILANPPDIIVETYSKTLERNQGEIYSKIDLLTIFNNCLLNNYT